MVIGTTNLYQLGLQCQSRGVLFMQGNMWQLQWVVRESTTYWSSSFLGLEINSLPIILKQETLGSGSVRPSSKFCECSSNLSIQYFYGWCSAWSNTARNDSKDCITSISISIWKICLQIFNQLHHVSVKTWLCQTENGDSVVSNSNWWPF